MKWDDDGPQLAISSLSIVAWSGIKENEEDEDLQILRVGNVRRFTHHLGAPQLARGDVELRSKS